MKCIYLSLCYDGKGYCFWNTTTNRVFINRFAHFFECGAVFSSFLDTTSTLGTNKSILPPVLIPASFERDEELELDLELEPID